MCCWLSRGAQQGWAGAHSQDQELVFLILFHVRVQLMKCQMERIPEFRCWTLSSQFQILTVEFTGCECGWASPLVSLSLCVSSQSGILTVLPISQSLQEDNACKILHTDPVKRKASL